ncbi:unnamed protein product [Gongylonema pulchrum]|uniref:Piezo transmembrane helical unit domain-containing protein n=1 Tax=Gongylonema pulchrum TaxID=637853 RepID=A0A3P7M5H2_9BILA|nr:unnamed protein product [Gongylonema pulchrum]
MSIPRPSKSFWLLTASYIQFIIVFRLLFRNELIPGMHDASNSWDNNPFSIRRQPTKKAISNRNETSVVQRLLAMDPSVDGSYWDVALLSMVFLHRYKLLRLGMWGDEFQARERRLSLYDDVLENHNNGEAHYGVFSSSS